MTHRQARYYQDDLEALPQHTTTTLKNNRSTILISLQSKLVQLEKQLYEINTALVSSTFGNILRNKPIFHSERYKIRRLKNKVASLHTNQVVISDEDKLNSATELEA